MRCTTIQLASAYSMFANGGKRTEAHCVREVSVRGGETFKTSAESKQIISDGAAFMMSTVLGKVVNGGYASFNYILDGDGSYPVYGKSGSTDWAILVHNTGTFRLPQ